MKYNLFIKTAAVLFTTLFVAGDIFAQEKTFGQRFIADCEKISTSYVLGEKPKLKDF